MKVLLAAGEVAPLAKTGGLADVAGSLPKALKQRGVDVRLVMPKYRGAAERAEAPLKQAGGATVPLGAQAIAQGSSAFHDLEMGAELNFMKAGIISADRVSTVSERYAGEIQTPEFGEGLESLLQWRSDALEGILNGIDYDTWNPRTDTEIAATFGPDDLSGKAACKQALQAEMDLPQRDVPVIGVVTRLTAQKGLDLIEAVVAELLAADVQLVILGTGDPPYHRLLEQLAQRLPDKTGITLAYDAALARRIYAGSDLFLIPSRYEPCGLTQMIGLAYGTIPIVRATGGLADTISERGPDGNGFVFFEYSPDALLAAVDRALAAYHSPKRWASLIRNAFNSDFSWEQSAGKYERMYRRAMEERGEQ